MTFHPGTQCEDPAAWSAYIVAAAEVATRAGVRLCRLNVGGGFPSHRRECAPELNRIFRTIGTAVAAAFGADSPQLVCEPGRAMVAEAVTIAARVKTVRSDGAVFLNDGIYGGLQEAGMLGAVDRIEVFSPDGRLRTGALQDRVVFGPTCDSLDRIAGTVRLPLSLEEEDYVLFDGMGAYSSATNTRFNGYGAFDVVTVRHSAQRV
jgi:ornithine decarboxylase